jgi:hypothetical protein
MIYVSDENVTSIYRVEETQDWKQIHRKLGD